MKLLFGFLFLLFCTGHVHAALQIPASYGTANHTTKKWQQIAEGSEQGIIGDSGIFWSTDGGVTWGKSEIRAGDSLMFRMDVFKNTVGTHYADHAKMWLDWDQNGVFSADEMVLYGEHVLKKSEPKLGDIKPKDRAFSFYSSIFHVGHDHVGELWLRGRVVCSESLMSSIGAKWKDQFNPVYQANFQNIFKPTGNYYQGESETLRLTVLPSLVVPPTPGDVPLYGVGVGALLLGWLASRRKSKV